jgi:hypothetical protein
MIQERLINHILYPQTWIPQANGNIHVARYHQNKVAPIQSFQAKDYTDTLAGRLLLLSEAEFHLLGFGIAILPYAGKIGKSIDGRFRKAVRSRFESSVIESIDSQCQNNHLFSKITNHGWSNIEEISLRGINALKTTNEFNQYQLKILDYRFASIEPAVSNLTIEIVEDLCKISLPNLSWLWQDPALA